MTKRNQWIMVWPCIWLAALLLLAFIVLSACGPTQFDANSRNECDSCTEDSDCKKDMTCEVFKTKDQNGSTMLVQRCAYSYTYQCD